MSNFPRVSIVIVTWRPENKPYLDLFMASLRNLSYPKEQLDVVLVARPGYMPQYPGVLTVSPEKDQFFATEAYNYGYKLISQDSHYVLTCNDDVCLTRDSLSILVTNSQAGGDSFISSPICNTDSGDIHQLLFMLPDGTALTKGLMKLGDYADDQLMNAGSVYSSGVFWGTHICMSSALIPRKLFNALEGFDPKFKGGPDDIDYCFRARALGYRMAYVLNAVIWHFGHITIDHSAAPEVWLYNVEYFKEKWGTYPTTVTEGYVERVRALLKQNTITEAARQEHTKG